VRNRGRMLTKDELLRQVWPDTFVEEVNLAVNISTLRKAIGDNARDGLYIVTVPGRGYRFTGDVHEVASELDPAAVPAPELPAEGIAVGRGQETSADRGPSGLVAEAPALAARVRSLKLAIPAAVAFLTVAIPGGYHWFPLATTSAPPATTASIAVLPFADLSPQKDQEYFSDGLTEELTSDLAKVPGLRVVARSSAFQFKGKNEDLRSVGRKLGVAHILEGSVSRQGDHIRIRAELTKAEDGFQLWSETYDRKIGDIFAVQDEIARAATKALQVKLVQGDAAALRATESTSSPEAYQAYLRARYFSTRGRDKPDLETALANAEQAIKLDPKYAAAWALRSYRLDTMADEGLIDPATGFRRAREDAERAIEVDSNGAAGYLALAWAQINRDWNWEGAEISLNKAAELAPGSGSIFRYQSFLCQARGQLKESIAFEEKAILLDPLLASSHSYFASLLYSAGEYQKAETALQRALELNPQKTWDHFTRGEILLAQGRPLPALQEMQQERGKSGDSQAKRLRITRLVVTRTPIRPCNSSSRSIRITWPIRLRRFTHIAGGPRKHLSGSTAPISNMTAACGP